MVVNSSVCEKVGVKGGEDGMGWTLKREEEGCGTSQGVLEGGGEVWLVGEVEPGNMLCYRF